MYRIRNAIQENAKWIDSELNRLLDCSEIGNGRLADAMRYSVQNGGKRIRALLVIEFCRMFNGSTQAALPYAAAIEFGHTASLIHDDMPCMDNDDIRRGKPSCHMAYDEHTSASPEAGSVASMPFVEEAVDGTLAEVPKEQVICGIPFYTRGWTVPFGTDVPQSEAMGMEQAYDFVTAHDITLSYDDSFGQNVGTSSDSEARYSIWMEDEQSVTNKINLIRQKELAGVAAWRIGFEKASVWSIITGGLE